MLLARLLIFAAAVLSLPSLAQQVVLVPNPNLRCNSTSSYALSRLDVRPDGTVSSDLANEWVIPAGYQLEVTDFSYAYGSAEPQWNFLDLFVVNRRAPTSSFTLESAVHTGSSTWNASGTLTRTGRISAPESQHRTFATPYVFNGDAKLCVGSPAIANYWNVRIIGRLMPVKAVVSSGSLGSTTLSP